MNTYVVTIKVVLEVDAVDEATALELAEDAVQRTRFGAGHKMLSIREYGQLQSMTEGRDRAAKSV